MHANDLDHTPLDAGWILVFGALRNQLEEDSGIPHFHGLVPELGHGQFFEVSYFEDGCKSGDFELVEP